MHSFWDQSFLNLSCFRIFEVQTSLDISISLLTGQNLHVKWLPRSQLVDVIRWLPTVMDISAYQNHGTLLFADPLWGWCPFSLCSLIDKSTLQKRAWKFSVSRLLSFRGFCGKGILMGTNCAPLLADIFLYSYEAEFIQSLLSTGRKQLASRFNFTYRYIDDVLSINNPEFENYLGQMYPVELEIKDTAESNTSASYLDLLLSIGRDVHLWQTWRFQFPHHKFSVPE